MRGFCVTRNNRSIHSVIFSCRFVFDGLKEKFDILVSRLYNNEKDRGS